MLKDRGVVAAGHPQEKFPVGAVVDGGDPVTLVDSSHLGEEFGDPRKLDRQNTNGKGEKFFEVAALKDQEVKAVGGEDKPSVVVGVDGHGAEN